MRMRATKLESTKRRNKSHSSSSSSISTAPPPKSSSILDTEFVSEELSLYQTTPYNNNNPRSFPYSVKQKCWEKAERVKGRDPDRWRRDVLGNTLFRKLVGCPGCLCHDYDHIVPYSKGGQSTLENCQVLQATVNRSKGNRTEISKADLIQKVLIAEFQAGIWIFSNYQPMATLVEEKMMGDVEFSSKHYCWSY